MSEEIRIVYIEGDGVGPEITPVMMAILKAAVQKAYGNGVELVFEEALAGLKAEKLTGESLPEATLERIREVGLAIKGPLMTPVGKGKRSLNVALRQNLDLYVCQRPVRHFKGVPSPVLEPDKVDMVVFRENTEDIYAGIEWPCGSPEVEKVIRFLCDEMGVDRIRFPQTSAIGVKPVSSEGSKRLIRAAIDYAISEGRKVVTLVHKGNIMKFTEGGFRSWGYELARQEYGAYEKEGRTFIPAAGGDILLDDCICDAFLQNILLRPQDYSVVATLNLNGDYISDALAAQVGGIGIAPGANINYETGAAIFEATHGVAPDIAGRDIANPLSLVLSGEMLLRYKGLDKAADLVVTAVERTLEDGILTADLYKLAKGQRPVRLVGTKAFGQALLDRL